MYNVFDYMNVQNIHNATFREIVSENGTSDYIMASGTNSTPSGLIADINLSLFHCRSATADTSPTTTNKLYSLTLTSMGSETLPRTP